MSTQSNIEMRQILSREIKNAKFNLKKLAEKVQANRNYNDVQVTRYYFPHVMYAIHFTLPYSDH